MPTPRSELSVITSCKKLTDYVMAIEEKSPKKFRYSIIAKMDTLLLELMERLYVANSYRVDDIKRLETQRMCKAKLKAISFVAEMGFGHGCYTKRQYETMAKHLYDCNASFLAWVKSDGKRRGDGEGVE